MKSRRLIFALILGLGSVILFWIVTSHQPVRVQAAPDSTVRYVAQFFGADSGDCTDHQSPCRTVQYALTQAGHGDTIQVANQSGPAIYTGTLYINESVTLQGGWNVSYYPGGGEIYVWGRPPHCEAYRTVLDAQGAGRVISITGSITPTIDCFTITGGDAAGLGGDPGSLNDAGALSI